MCETNGYQFEIERIQALAEALRAKEEFLQVALDAAEVGTWIYFFADHLWHMDERAQALYRMPARTMPHTDTTLKGIIHPDDMTPMWKHVAEAANPRGSGRYQMQYRVLQPDGSVRWLAAWGRVDFEGDGTLRRPVRMVGEIGRAHV